MEEYTDNENHVVQQIVQSSDQFDLNEQLLQQRQQTDNSIKELTKVDETEENEGTETMERD